MNKTFTLDAREAAEIRLSHIYATQFNHGTAGHFSYLLISKLATRIEEMEAELDALRGKQEPTQRFMD